MNSKTASCLYRDAVERLFHNLDQNNIFQMGVKGRIKLKQLDKPCILYQIKKIHRGHYSEKCTLLLLLENKQKVKFILFSMLVDLPEKSNLSIESTLF